MKFEVFNNLAKKISVKAGRTGLVLKKYSPEIALGTGIVGVIGTVVLACKGTMHVDQVLENHQERLDRIQEGIDAIANGEVDEGVTYPEKAIAHDKLIVYCKTVGEFAKAYAPAFITGTISIALILYSHGLLKKRYLGAVAAYNAVSEAFKTYRDRVRAEGGDDLDRHYMFGTERCETTKEIIDESGKKKKIKETVEVLPENSEVSEFARVFDRENRNWNRDPDLSRMFLKAQKTSLNILLDTRGHVFLNEVFDALGYPHTPVGAVVGWVKGNKDSYIDFGIDDASNPEVRRFINGEDNVITLNFNVDGAILDLI